MAPPITRISSDIGHDYIDRFDTIIDVRSPAEFADDHIPGAINLPVLNDQQRAEIGTIYKQINPFTAKRVGAALWRKILPRICKPHYWKKRGTGARLSIVGAAANEVAQWHKFLATLAGIAL